MQQTVFNNLCALTIINSDNTECRCSVAVLQNEKAITGNRKKSGGIKTPYNLGWGYEKPSKFESEVWLPPAKKVCITLHGEFS